MRTTITLADDVAAAVEERMRHDHVGRSQAVNDLARAGLRQPKERPDYRLPPVRDLGARIDLTCTGEVLGLLDELDAENSGASAG